MENMSNMAPRLSPAEWRVYDKAYEASFVHVTHVANLSSIVEHGIKVSTNNSSVPVSFFVNPLATGASEGMVQAATWANSNWQNRISSVPKVVVSSRYPEGLAVIRVRALVGPYSTWHRAVKGHTWKAVNTRDTPPEAIVKVTLFKDVEAVRLAARSGQL